MHACGRTSPSTPTPPPPSDAYAFTRARPSTFPIATPSFHFFLLAHSRPCLVAFCSPVLPKHSRYVDACAELGVPQRDLFITGDLFENKHWQGVLKNIHGLARLAHYDVEEFRGPRIGIRKKNAQTAKDKTGCAAYGTRALRSAMCRACRLPSEPPPVRPAPPRPPSPGAENARTTSTSTVLAVSEGACSPKSLVEARRHPLRKLLLPARLTTSKSVTILGRQSCK